MKKLSRDEMKNVVGGLNALACTSDGDCPSRSLDCNGTSTPAVGDCVNGKCKWVAVC